jgi:digeranylgeranylglycerophospholipid reductase
MTGGVLLSFWIVLSLINFRRQPSDDHRRGDPVAKSLKKIATDGLLIVGDAARQVNPVTGGGILAAITAGKLAGTVASKAIERDDWSLTNLKEYQTEWDKSVGKDYARFYNIKEWITKLPIKI